MRKPVSLFLLSIVLTVSGCSTVPVEETFPAELVPGEYQNAASIIFNVDVLTIQELTIELMEEEDIVSCLENRIKKHNPDQAFISYYKFVKTMFPDLFEMEVSREPESFSRLLADEKFYKDVLSWGVRYLIFVSGSTKETDEFGWFGCDEGCFGYQSWDKKTRLTASILDLHQKETVIDDLENISEGTGWVAAFIIPIGFPTFTESTACGDMGNRISKILLDRVKQ